MVNRKQWVSSARDTYRAPQQLPITNYGIIAENAKRAHKKIESII